MKRQIEYSKCTDNAVILCSYELRIRLGLPIFIILFTYLMSFLARVWQSMS